MSDPRAEGGEPTQPGGLNIPPSLKVVFGIGIVFAFFLAQRMIKAQNPFVHLQPGAGKIVAVLYFENGDDPSDADSTGARLARLVTADLARRADLHIPPPEKVRQFLAARGYAGHGPADPLVAIRAGNDMGAARLVIGTVAHRGAVWRGTAQVVETSSGKLTKPLEVLRPEAEPLDSLAAGLARGVLGELGVGEN